MTPVGQRLYFGDLRLELCRGAVHLIGPGGLEFLRKPWPCFCLDSLPAAPPMSQSYFLRNAANSLEPCQRFTMLAACTINPEQLPSMQPLSFSSCWQCPAPRARLRQAQGEVQLHVQTLRLPSVILGSDGLRVYSLTQSLTLKSGLRWGLPELKSPDTGEQDPTQWSTICSGLKAS